jgi:CheY-like chemotaxis protein
MNQKAPQEQDARLVLVIEDNRDFAQLFGNILELVGCRLALAPDGESGLAKAREIKPDLVFCDLMLPGAMTGFQFAQAVRADADLSGTPLVAVSGLSSEDHRDEALAAGFDKFYPKPIKFAHIKEAVAAFLEKQ